LVRGQDEWNHAHGNFADRLEVIMSPIEKIKAEASALQAKEKALGKLLKRCDALERVAQDHGYKSWRACRAFLGMAPAALHPPPGTEARGTNPEMKSYRSADWNFALDIPARWNSFPPVSANSQYEVIRFASHEDGVHLLIIFRKPHDPKKSLDEISQHVKEVLGGSGFSHFVTAETTLNGKAALTLDFDKPQGTGTWSCREYFVVDGTLGYTLGFGTNRKADQFDLFDRMAKSFEIVTSQPLSRPEPLD
jgi:hypothetical protein